MKTNKLDLTGANGGHGETNLCSLCSLLFKFGVVLITAHALMRKVEQSIRDRSTFSLSQLTTELFGNKIISS